jgi:hypothetical protein
MPVDPNSERAQKLRNETLKIRDDYKTRMAKVVARMKLCYYNYKEPKP